MITEWVYTINVKLRSLHARVLPVPVYRKRRCRRSLLVCVSPCEVLVPPCLWKTWTSLSKCGLYVTWQTMTISEQVDYAPRDLSSQLRLKHGIYKNLVLVLWHTPRSCCRNSKLRSVVRWMIPSKLFWQWTSSYLTRATTICRITPH